MLDTDAEAAEAAEAAAAGEAAAAKEEEEEEEEEDSFSSRCLSLLEEIQNIIAADWSVLEEQFLQGEYTLKFLTHLQTD